MEGVGDGGSGRSLRSREDKLKKDDLFESDFVVSALMS
jgi:hypothetical protein